MDEIILNSIIDIIKVLGLGSIIGVFLGYYFSKRNMSIQIRYDKNIDSFIEFSDILELLKGNGSIKHDFFDKNNINISYHSVIRYFFYIEFKHLKENNKKLFYFLNDDIKESVENYLWKYGKLNEKYKGILMDWNIKCRFPENNIKFPYEFFKTFENDDYETKNDIFYYYPVGILKSYPRNWLAHNADVNFVMKSDYSNGSHVQYDFYIFIKINETYLEELDDILKEVQNNFKKFKKELKL